MKNCYWSLSIQWESPREKHESAKAKGAGKGGRETVAQNKKKNQNLSPHTLLFHFLVKELVEFSFSYHI